MIKQPPQEKQWLSWLYVASWTLMVFAAIPLARTIQQYVSEEWSRDLFTYGVAAVTVMALVIAVIYLRCFRPVSRSSYFWLIAIAGIFIGYTLDLAKLAPEEAVHFIQYGVLGILVYRALTHRLKDSTVFFAAAVICGGIGVIDEFIQWLTPLRVWGLRDIWINFLSAVLVQVAIAKGLQPVFIAHGFNRKNMRFLCCLLIAAFVILGSSFLITPPRIIWFAEHVKGAAFLKYNDSVMLEYGYLYEDPDIGVFRSRFSPEKLKQLDRERAVGAAEILNLFQGEKKYKIFLQFYTPISDPFVHEARVHLFRRNRYLRTALYHKNDPEEFDRRMAIAFRENQIMEKYFHDTLQLSDYTLSQKQQSLAGQYLLGKDAYESSVSKDLTTRVSERQVAGLLMVFILGLILLRRYLGNRPEIKSSSKF